MSLILAPWEQRFNGRTWKDMPGTTSDDKKMNFALFRRGKLTEADIEAWEADVEEKQTTGKPGLNRAKRSLAKSFNKGRRHRVEQLRLEAEQRELEALTIPKGADAPVSIPEPMALPVATVAELVAPSTVKAIVQRVPQTPRMTRKPAAKVKMGGVKRDLVNGSSPHCSKYLMPWM